MSTDNAIPATVLVRQTPKTGERWLFSNGVTATIYEVTDSNYGFPECAYMGDDPESVAARFFKFNDTRDPMPVRKVDR